MKAYALNAEEPSVDRELCIPFAWPFDAWECVVPSGVVPKINILEKLILSLVESGAVTSEADLQSFLQKDIGLNGELIENAFAICQEKGYINKVSVTLALNRKGRDILTACETGVLTGHDYAESRKRVYLFKDLITNAVVPYFETETLPDYWTSFDEKSGIVVQEKQASGIRPKTAQCGIAMRAWWRILKERMQVESAPPCDLNLAVKPDPEVLAEEESEPEQSYRAGPSVKEETQAYDLMQINSDKPDCLYLIGYFVINRYCTSDIKVISPFGATCDGWFRNLVNRLRLGDAAFEDRLSSMVDAKKESLGDKIAFNNDPVIALFEKQPVICNNVKYNELRNRILIMHNYLEDTRNRDTHFSSFAGAMRQAIEDAARYAVQARPEVETTRADMKSQFRKTGSHRIMFERIYTASPDFDFGRKILDHMINARPGEICSTKDALALFVIHSVEHPKHKTICNFVTSCHDWIRDITPLINMLNKPSHGEKASMEKTPEEYYHQAEKIIDDLFSYLILKGGK